MRFLLAALLGVALPTFAGEHRIPEQNPIVRVEIPDAWDTNPSENGLETVSADQLLYLAVGYVGAGQTSQFLDNALNFLDLNGVKVDHDTVEQQDMKLNGMEVVDVQWKGTDSGGPCEITLDLVGVTEEEGLMVLYWGPPGSDETYAKELKAIFKSIQPAHASAD